VTVKGRVIAPGASFDSYHEVLQLDEQRLMGWGYTNSTGEFSISPQPPGRYYIVVRIDGFKEYRNRIDVDGCDFVHFEFAFMEPEAEPIPQVILDFTGEVNEVVDVADLKRQFPRKAVLEFERAKEERLKGQSNLARNRLEKLLREFPDFYDARNALGSVYLEAKKFREAEIEYNKARELRPSSAAPWVSLGSLYIQEAEAAADDDNSDVLLIAADTGVILDDAKSVLEQAVKLKPDAAFAYYLLGVAQWRSRQEPKGELNLRKALSLEPKLRWSRLALGDMYIKQGRLREALAEIDAYLVEFKKVANTPEVQKVRDKIAAELAGKSP
jgi:tetratricopeptide (TPR) repeat protein